VQPLGEQSQSAHLHCGLTEDRQGTTYGCFSTFMIANWEFRTFFIVLIAPQGLAQDLESTFDAMLRSLRF
jgi:hypothetical protein